MDENSNLISPPVSTTEPADDAALVMELREETLCWNQLSGDEWAVLISEQGGRELH